MTMAMHIYTPEAIPFTVVQDPFLQVYICALPLGLPL